LKLNNFFKTPSTPRKDYALSPFVMDGTSAGIVSTKSPRAPTPVGSVCDFDKEFKEFWVKPNVTMAPTHTTRKDDECRAAVNRALDEALALPSQVKHEDTMDINTATGSETRGITKEQIVELLHIPPHKANLRRGNTLPYSTKDVLARINTPDDPGLPALIPTGSTKPEKLNLAYYLQILNSLPYKFLKFAEDVRPPYNGTYTRIPTSSGLLHGKNPFQRALPMVDYDCDSEAEWVADDEGEELLSEDEEDRESEAGESLNGFLDDEDDVALKRGGLGILVAMNSGVCWEDEKGKNPRPDLEEMRIHVLLGMLNRLLRLRYRANWFIRGGFGTH
jgi:chromatin assembly factor 1 subunit A